MGVPYPLMDLDRQMRSGMIPAVSKDNNQPVRPQPIWMSSATSRVPCARVHEASALSQAGRAGLEAAGKPDPLIVGAAHTLLEAGEEPTDLSPTPLAGPTHGPGNHPGNTSRPSA